MYNPNYRNERDRQDVNFQAWQSLHAQHQQRAAQPIHQQTVPLQQQHGHRQTASQPPPSQQQQHGHRQTTSQPPSTQQQQQPTTGRERLWVEIPDDEDSISGHSSIFKSNVKSQSTPPLDLSTMEKAKLGPRHVESPLDLSVKPRKRVANTTEYADQVHGHLSDHSMAKRMYMSSHYRGSVQGISKERQMTMPTQPDQQKYYMEAMAKAKMSQKQALSKQAPPRLSPHSPHMASQQQYASLQRQHQMQQIQHSHHQQQQHQQQQRARQMSMSPGQICSTPDSLKSPSHQYHRQNSPYPTLSNHPGATPSPHSNSSETVALQGFFEPTQRLTVNTSMNRPNYKGITESGRTETSVYHGSQTLAIQSNVPRQREETAPNQVVRNAQYLSPSTAISTSGMRAEIGMHPSVNASNVSQMEAFQQRQLQRQRQLQVQREQSVVFSNVPSPSTHGRVIHPDRGNLSQLYDMQKRSEAGLMTAKMPYPMSQEHVAAYSQKLQQQYMSSNSSHTSQVQDERKIYSNTRGSNEIPVMSDIPKSASFSDKVLMSQYRHGNMSQASGSSENINMFQQKSHKTGSVMASLDSRQRAMQRDLMEQEQRYRMGITGENSTRQFRERMEQMSSIRRDVHPSVIQRPQGFIPPRIVSGSGRSSSTSSINTDQSTHMSDIAHRRYSTENKISDTNRDSVSIEKLYRRSGTDQVSRSVQRDSKLGSHIREETVVNRSSVPQNISSINNHNRDLTKRQMHHQSKTRMSPEGVHMREQYQRRSSDSVNMTQRNSSDRLLNSDRNKSGLEKKDARLKQNSAVMASALSGVMIPQVTNKSSERSITKGTSGVKKGGQTRDLFSHIVMRELKKTEEACSVNPFANRSILSEYDRSRNTPTDFNTEHQAEESEIGKSDSNDSNIPFKSYYDSPLQISIPAGKAGASTSGLTERGSLQTIADQNMKIEADKSKTPKILSRKQMILRAFKQDEDMKNTVNIDKDQKIPMESHKFASAKRSEKDTLSQSPFPASPKMPILSPQEKNRTTPIVSPGGGDPPNLEATPVSGVITPSNTCSTQNKSNSDINSFEEHLHRLISDAVKGSVNKDKDSVYETVRRELNTQPQGKVFITRQLSQNRNIPVANVAPIVHGRNINETSSGRQEPKAKVDIELDEEDQKLAAVVTRSLFEPSSDVIKEIIGKEEEVQEKDIEIKDIKIEPERNITVAHSIVETEFKPKFEDNIFSEESNSSKRMSPGLKKLMLYRHRDLADNSVDSEATCIESDHSLSHISDTKPSTPASAGRSNRESPRDIEGERNVFGTFNEILAQNFTGKSENEYTTATWSEIKMEDEELDIQMVPNTDYDGDDDGDDEDTKDQKKLPRRSRKSSVKQQADRLIKKARHRRKSEGMCRSRTQFTTQRSFQKGFVDFTPQVLPNRTRFRLKGQSPTRKNNKRGTSPIKKRRSLGREAKRSKQGKLRQRRSSSLDRNTKKTPSKKVKKQICFSDNEIDNVGGHLTGNAVDDNWHDESTDEEYFQNYQDKFTQKQESSIEKSKDSVDATPVKKVSSTKKRKGFHFKQKYIFQRKRKPKNKNKVAVQDTINRSHPEYNLSFHEELGSFAPIPDGSAEIGFHDDIPIPPEVKRLVVNKDTGETLLHKAARIGYQEVALYCLATGSVDVNARDNAGYTALHECCVRGQQEIARILLTHGADVNCCSVDGIRPIHDAVETDQIEMVRLLLSFGADPTLSTYAGRSLLKIARSERMKKFLHDYHNDLNGYDSESLEKPWSFEYSSTLLEPEDKKGCPIFTNLPSDPEEEEEDLCTLSAKPLFVNRRLTPEHGKRVEDYVLLHDILSSYNVTHKEFDSLAISAHFIKQLSVHMLHQTLSDSIFVESLTNKEDQETVPALRAVDSAHIVAKLEKYVHSTTKRSKS